MKIEINPVKEYQKEILKQLLELYEYDFSEYTEDDTNESGFYEYKYLDLYWREKGRSAFLILVDGKYAGFVLVNEMLYVLKNQKAKSIAEFFIMKKYRRKKIGSFVAETVFKMFPGKWEVIQHEKNKPAKEFWLRVISKYTNNDYRIENVTTEEWHGQAIIFEK